MSLGRLLEYCVVVPLSGLVVGGMLKDHRPHAGQAAAASTFFGIPRFAFENLANYTWRRVV